MREHDFEKRGGFGGFGRFDWRDIDE